MTCCCFCRVLPSSPVAETLRDDLAVLMPYAVEIRYPDDWFMPSAQDAAEARAAAEAVVEWLKKSKPVLFGAHQSGHKGPT